MQRIDEIHALYLAGASMSVIAKRVGIRHDYVRKLVSVARKSDPDGWPYRKSRGIWITYHEDARVTWCKCHDCQRVCGLIMDEDDELACPYCLAPDSHLERLGA